jgi:hypothetical protein
MILLQVNFVSGDEFKTVSKGFYKIENISIFAWFQFLALNIIVGCVVRFIDYLLITSRIV